MKRKLPLILAMLLFVSFTGAAVAGVQKERQQFHSKNIQLESKTFKLQKIEVEYKKLNQELEAEKHKDTIDQQKIQQLEQKVKEQDEAYKALQVSKAQQKAEQQRLADASRRAVNTVTGTQTASAAPATGSGCDWLRGKLASMGVASGDIPAAISIAQRESGCRPTAQNPSSGACNLFQELPCGKWGGLGNTDAHIRGAIAYAHNRYGGWWGAYNFWQANHWW